ncbi:MAG: FkbM family methyltransferase [Bacteroidota bacterium]
MIDKTELAARLNGIEKLARGGIVDRFLSDPVRYVSAILFWRLIYPLNKKGKFVDTATFFGKSMQVVLPAATEIFLFGAKTHDSEIRLARFLIEQLNSENIFCDVGAHFGYFSLLASYLVGPKGKVISFEASKNTFSVFHKNVKNEVNIIAENKAAAESNNVFTFYEYPVLYSEYNSLKKTEADARWLKSNPPKKSIVAGQQLGAYFLEKNIFPAIIKIDVEGAELQVLNGMSVYLEKNYKPVIVMEYITDKSQNTAHENAIAFLRKKGFETYIINKTGKLVPEKNIKDSLKERNLNSDNIVLKKI